MITSSSHRTCSFRTTGHTKMSGLNYDSFINSTNAEGTGMHSSKKNRTVDKEIVCTYT